MIESYDVIIGGGAVMGSSIAYHLAAHQGFTGRILVVDRDMTYAQAASSLSLSSIRQQFSSPINIRVGLYGVSFLRRARDKKILVFHYKPKKRVRKLSGHRQHFAEVKITKISV